MISELVDSFNKIKENLEEYKEDIANKFASSTNPLRQQAPSRPRPERFWRFTRYRKQEDHQGCVKLKTFNQEGLGYSSKNFEAISLQALYSPAIRETMTIWEKPSMALFHPPCLKKLGT